MKIDDELSFEDAVKKLENIIKSISDESLELNKTIENYELGIDLFNYCRELLEKAENKITEIHGNL